MKIRKSVELAALNLVSYLVLTVDFRATSQGNYAWAAGVNIVIALLSMTILKRIVEARSVGERIGYALGGSAGTVAGIWLSKLPFLLGQ